MGNRSARHKKPGMKKGPLPEGSGPPLTQRLPVRTLS